MMPLTARQTRKKKENSSELPILCEKDNSQEASDHAPPMVSGTAQLPMLLLTIAAFSFAT